MLWERETAKKLSRGCEAGLVVLVLTNPGMTPRSNVQSMAVGS